LPRPGVLRRHTPDAPLAPGPVLVLGTPASAEADAVAQLLLSADGGDQLDVRRAAAGDTTRWGAVVVVLSDVAHPSDLAAPMLELSGVLRSLTPGGRVVTISRAATASDSPAVAAARQGVDGALRSLAKELRAGSTANGIVL